jgi:Aerotolerance regulator N-terminal/von Willebrand factor type A domain
MSFLTPLYVLGLLAVAAPIIFHLIRRSPKGEVPFSSLMFLSSTPPRLTRRSRLDHLLLLLLRATALTLLAIAFARPFLRQAARLDAGDVARRRVAVLVDTSASMRRGDLWKRAKELAQQTIDACRPTDQVALFSFAESTQPLLSFDESATLDPARRQAIAKAHLNGLAPTWGATHLGQALIDAVAAVEEVADTSEKAGRMPRRVVLISDLQQGSRLDVLGGFEWPSDVELELKTVSDTGSNAGLHSLADLIEPDASKDAPQLRVRVSNNPNSRQEKFELLWTDENGVSAGKPIEAYVPPGESRVVRVPLPPGSSSHRSLRLLGDTHAFDNTLFFADEPREESTVLYVGTDAADDPSGLLYYLERVFYDTPRRGLHIVSQLPSAELTWESDSSLGLVILTSETTPENIRRLQEYLRGGGTLLYVMTAAGRASTLAALTGASPWDVEEASVERDVMLGDIAFENPLFAPLAGAQFNDFTKIHFWKYRHIKPNAIDDARVIARFENGDIAVAEKTLGKGRLVVLASGWQPADSQLARSSKFVPLMSALLEERNPRPIDAASHIVHDRVPLPVVDGDAKPRQIRKPDGALVTAPAGSTFFAETDQPGLYTIEIPAGPQSFAVNLDPMESKTSALHLETLEQFGCRLSNPSRKRDDREYLRQMHSVELESRQKLWRYLILAAIGVLIVETWLAGRLKQPRLARAEA